MFYEKEYTKEIILPIGGIGSGSIGYTGNGRFIDVELNNRPSQGSLNGYSHMAIRAKKADGSVVAKVLNGDQLKDLTGQYGGTVFNAGYGHGQAAYTMVGFSHFRNWSFEGDFPFARLSLSDPDFPGDITVTAFNPMIPNDVKDSVIPAAFFEICVQNTAAEEIEYTAAFSFRNLFEKSRNSLLPAGNGVYMKNAGDAEDEAGYGDLSLSGSGGAVKSVVDWYRGSWQDGVATYWREFNTPEGLSARDYGTDGELDTCTVTVTEKIGAGMSHVFRFVLTWNIPNYYNYWDPMKDADGKDVLWKNYYATVWKDSADSNAYAAGKFTELKERTEAFIAALKKTTLDPVMLNAAISALSVLHTPTCMLLEDGSFYGWEGMNQWSGSCEGSCTHVWNYAYALCFLFPSLERSMHTLDYKYNLQENGGMRFRLPLPPGRNDGILMPCVDGQMGGIIKLYRDWKLSGNEAYLKETWPLAKKALEFAWSPENPFGWDADKDGLLEGRQHHTLDMELFGPSSWLQSMYLEALAAGAAIAEHLGETESAAEYRELFKKGQKKTEEELWNGEYYYQKVDLKDRALLEKYADAMVSLVSNDVRSTYWNPETGELKYQIGEGCEIDQMLGDWHAAINRLPSVFDPERKKTALKSLMKYNHHESFRGFSNPWRNYYLNDEGGTLMLSYPEGRVHPSISVPYSEETMHGFEYALAGLLMANGCHEDAVKVVKAVRDRYDGKKRNPYNEIECGGHYARSMASFALIPIAAGFIFDLPEKKIGFDPLKTEWDREKGFGTFFSVDGAYGTFEILPGGKEAVLNITEGCLAADRLVLPFVEKVDTVTVDGESVLFTFENGELSLPEIRGTVDITFC